MPKKKGEAQEERKEIARIQLKKEEGSGNQRKLTIHCGTVLLVLRVYICLLQESLGTAPSIFQGPNESRSATKLTKGKM